MDLMGRGFAQATVIDSVSVPDTSAVTHEGLDTSGYSEMTFLVESSGSITVYLQFSDDNVSWYDIKSLDDSDVTWNCNNEKICVAGTIAARYTRLVVHNASGSAVTVTAKLMVRV